MNKNKLKQSRKIFLLQVNVAVVYYFVSYALDCGKAKNK